MEDESFDFKIEEDTRQLMLSIILQIMNTKI